jgi:hypothetical protein
MTDLVVRNTTHGLPISMAAMPARNGSGIDTAARSHTTRGHHVDYPS